MRNPSQVINRRHALHLGALLALIVAVRYVLFPHIGIWGDAGFYIYDGRLINRGLTPYVDFVGRSPLFNYAYAAVAQYAGNTMPVLRVFIAVFWVLCIFPVYYIAREIDGHAAGLAAAATMGLTPFMLVYGYWANTQSLAAFLAICGIAALAYRERPATYAVAGSLLGAAFFSRRSVITVPGAVCIYALYRGYQTRDVRRPVAWSVATVGCFLGTLGVGYLALASWRPGMALQFAETHGWALISSSGRGGFPLLTDNPTPDVTNSLDSGRIPIFNDLCQMCGAWTARTFAKTTLVTTPVIGPVFWYFRDWSDHLFSDRLRDYTLGVLLLLALYGIVSALLAGFYVRPITALVLVGFGVLAFRTPAIDRDVLYHRHVVLCKLCLLGLAAGYLYRNRVLHTYYFTDFWPFLSPIVGVVVVAIWRVMDE